MGNRKEEILIVALHLFARDGYEAVSVSQIAGELDMTKGALYRHYKSKRDIFDCIVQRMEQQDGEQATEYESSTEVSNEKIKQGLDGNDPEVFAAVLTESVQKSLEKNRYGKAVTVNVSVEKDNSGKYGLLDTEMNKLEAAMFPTE